MRCSIVGSDSRRAARRSRSCSSGRWRRATVWPNAAGFLIQPVSGVPFKVWAVIAGGQGISPVLVIPAFIAARMLAVGAIATAAGRLLRPRLRDWFAAVAALYVVLFAVGFAAIVG